MAIIANDKNLVKEFVRINFVNSNSSFPDFGAAEETFLLPIIGQDLYDIVKALAADPPILNPTPEQVQNEDLVRRCRALIVPYAYLTELGTIQTQLTDAGLRTISTENMQSAHRWEFNEVREYLLDKVGYAMESLLRFLFLHADYYTEWTDSEEYKKLDALIFHRADEFDEYFKTHQPYRNFWELRPLISEVQDFYISPVIGEAFFIELKNKVNPSVAEKEIIILIKKCVAQLTIVKAIEKLSVKKTDKGFVVAIGSGAGEAANAGSQAPTDNQLSLLYASCERSGEAYLLKLSEQLNKQASNVVFATYFASDYYKDLAKKIEDPNCKRKIIGF